MVLSRTALGWSDLLMVAELLQEAAASPAAPLSQSGGHGGPGKVTEGLQGTEHHQHFTQLFSQQEDETNPLIDQALSSDPELLSAATKFVAEIIEKAKAEAAIRLKRKKLVSRNF